MPGDGLHEPLGATEPQGRLRTPSLSRIAALALGLLIVGFGAYVVAKDDGTRGEPFVVASIERVASPPAATPPAIAAPGTPETPYADVDVEHGVSVVRLRAAPSGAAIIKVPQGSSAGLAAGPDPRLIEKSPFGPLPKIGPDGTKPASAYARPASLDPAASIAGKARIALLVGGMGLDRAATMDAARLLPGAVSFGFTPYGDDIAAQVAAVRAAGHEVVLQVPMEASERAEAGQSHMLLTGQGGNRERLHWLMSRFTGYAGLGNAFGSRFLADAEALRPVLQDVAARGLFFFDDGTAARSLVPTLASDIGLPSLRADVVLDASADAAAIGAALHRLEGLAHQRGSAIGSAGGSPGTVAALAQGLADLASRGLVLVPVSAVAGSTHVTPAGDDMPTGSLPAARGDRNDGPAVHGLSVTKP